MQKVTMYDFLTMVVSGFLILLLFTPMKGLSEESILFFVACYVVGMVYHKIVEKSLSCVRNCKCFLKKSYARMDEKFKIKEKMPFSEEEYLRGYYILMEKQCLNSIPVLEAQEAFVRNIIPILVRYIPVLGCCDSVLGKTILRAFGEECCFGGILMVLVFGLLFTWYSLRMKISYLVWEGYYFLDVRKHRD
ncbi:MAG: hypothetical protein K2I90_09135 [Odoribacter sp.]|nr:hypothetical protein [Odoribacter sp.]